MIFCPNCGKELPDGAMFCGECGARVAAQSQTLPGQPAEQSLEQPVVHTFEQPAAPPPFEQPIDRPDEQLFEQSVTPPPFEQPTDHTVAPPQFEQPTDHTVAPPQFEQPADYTVAPPRFEQPTDHTVAPPRFEQPTDHTVAPPRFEQPTDRPTEQPIRQQADQSRPENNPPVQTDEGASAAPASKKGLPKPALIGVIAAAAIAVVLLLIFLLPGGSGARNNAFYVKDKDIYMNKGKADAEVKITSDYGKENGSNALISPDGKILVYRDKTEKGNTFYFKHVNKDEDGVKIDSDVDDYIISENSKYFIYTKNGNLYRYDFNNQEKSKKQASDVSGSVYVTPNGKKAICASKEKIIALTFEADDAETLAKEARILFVTEDLKTVYYAKKADENGIYTLCRQKVGSGEEIVISKDVSSARIYASGEIYFDKTDVDEAEGTRVSTLFYYDGKNDPVKIADDYSVRARASKTPVLIYSVTDEDDTEYYFVIEGNEPIKFNADNATSFQFTEDGKTVYFFDNVDSESDEMTGDIMVMEVSGSSAGTPEVYQKNVSAEEFYVSGDDVCYFKDYTDGEGTLYINEEKIAQGVNDVYPLPMYGLYLIEADESEDDKTVYIYKDGELTLVGKEIRNYTMTADCTFYYLADEDEGEYDLYVSKKGEAEKIDDEVTALVNVIDTKMYYEYYGDLDIAITLY